MKFLNFKFDPSNPNLMGELRPNSLKVFIAMAAALLVLVGIIAASIFFVAVRGGEQTLVPELRGKELSEALLELQAKELYPRIQRRYSQSARDKGLILEQDPAAGTIVKAGRRIRMVVSQGVIINRVENYIGRNIEDVRMDIQTLAASSGSSPLSLKEPMYDFSGETPGTIIRQKPEAGTDISGPTSLEFVVSRGQEDSLVTAPQLVGLSISSALEQIGRAKVAFEFTLRERQEGERGETVVYQNPPAGASVTSDVILNLTVNYPSRLRENEVFGLFEYTMPQNPYPLPVRLEALLPSGDRKRIIDVDYPGGKFTAPYRLPADSVLVLYLMNREIYRETVEL
ncbi:MAG: PASTA domain-containing protein [Treponema sp.]|jgi:beta-lactam-binding protein with PASTA domain|nr:PASTA domain-containing protein [Treponema sp.]